MNSQRSRAAEPEIDPIWLGNGWTPEDLKKPQVLLESAWSDSHPGSRHLNELVEMAKIGVYKCGGKPSQYTVTDICDGVATGHGPVSAGVFFNGRRGFDAIVLMTSYQRVKNTINKDIGDLYENCHC